MPDGSLDHGSRHGKHRGLYTDRIPAVHLYPHVIDTVASLRRCQTAVRTHNILRHISDSISCRTGHAEIIENVFRIESVPVLGSIPIIGDLLFKNTYITTYIGLLFLVLAWVIIYKTRFGLRLRACGELPQAADSAGISVYKMRYAGTLISGFLAGIGGLIFVVPTSNVFNADVAGYGFLALAVLIFGQWKPFRIFFAALFFGFMKTVAATSSGIPFLAGLNIPPYIYKMVPYIATLIVLAFVSKNSAAPAAEGEPFDKGKR